MQTGRDCVALFGHAPDADCRMLPHGWIALSGEPLAADLNMLGLTADADEREFSQALESVQGRGLDVLLIVDEGAEAGRVLGCGIFVRSDDHVGIYTMATPVENQRRGVGGAVLATAMAHYQHDGVTRFTLGATEQGFGLYERMGFEVVSRPEVFVIGQSTQFSGD